MGFTQRGSRLTWTQDVLASPQGGWRSQTALRSLGTTCFKERWLLAILSLHITWNETISQFGYVGTRLMIPFTGGETSQGTQEGADHVESTNNQYGSWDYALRALILNLRSSGKYQCWCWPTGISMSQNPDNRETGNINVLLFVHSGNLLCKCSHIVIDLCILTSVDKLSHTARPPPTVIWCVHPLFSSLFVSFTSLFVYLFVLVVPERV